MRRPLLRMFCWLAGAPAFCSGAAASSLAEVEALLETVGTSLAIEAEQAAYMSSGAPTQVVEDPQAGNGKWVRLDCRKPGEAITFDCGTLPRGYYALTLRHLCQKSFGAAAVSVNGEVIGRFVKQFKGDGEGLFSETPAGTFFQKEAGPLTITLTLIGGLMGNTPFLSADRFTVAPAPLRDRQPTGARNGGLRVDAVALARRRAEPAPKPGRGCAPYYALPAYDASGASLPADALDRKDFPNMTAWFKALSERKRPGRIGSGTYTVSLEELPDQPLTQSLYGYDSGGGLPVLDGCGRPALFYLQADGVTLQGLAIRNVGIAVIGMDHWKAYTFGGKKGLWQWFAYQPEGHPERVRDADLKDLSIMDCAFDGVGIALLVISEFHGVRNLHVGRNRVTRGKGFVAVTTYEFGDIHIYQNAIDDCDQGMAAGNASCTLVWLGTNDITHQARNRNVFVEFNEARNVRSAHSADKVNASVFADIRDCSNVSLSYNILKDLTNSAAHSDCNAIYSKADDLVVDACVFESCGANDSASPGDIGSEGGCLTLKGETSPGARFGTLVERCTFTAGSVTEVPMVLFNHGGVLRDCTFKGWNWTGTSSKRRYLIQKYSGLDLAVINVTLESCGGTDALAFREDNAVSAAIGWKGIFRSQAESLFTGVNFICGCDVKRE